MTTYIAFFLHIYQPPWQDIEILKQIYKECYIPLIAMIERHSNAKITFNLQGCLLDLLNEYNLKDIIPRMQDLITHGKIELVGSAKYHPILPFIPPQEIRRQITLNEQTLLLNFPMFNRKGFFPPEMAMSPDVCNIIHQMGYTWILADGIAHPEEWPQNYIDQLSSKQIIFYRDTYLSNLVAFNQIDASGFIHQLHTMFDPELQGDRYVIIALDGETFGHHIKLAETSFLGKVFSLMEDNLDICPCLMSDLQNHFSFHPIQRIHASSWSTTGEDLASNVPYPLWGHPLNPVHKYQHRILKALYRLMEYLERKYADTTSHVNHNFMHYYQTARYFFDMALHSCWLWWASLRVMWSPNLIYKGVELIQKTALNAQLALINLKVGQGEEFYTVIMNNLEKLMNEIIQQESQGQHIRTYDESL